MRLAGPVLIVLLLAGAPAASPLAAQQARPRPEGRRAEPRQEPQRVEPKSEPRRVEPKREPRRVEPKKADPPRSRPELRRRKT